MILPIRKVGGGPNISELTADPGMYWLPRNL